MRAMRFDRAKAHVAKARDLDVGVTERDQPQHLLLLRRESERRIPGLAQPCELDTQRRLEIRLTACDGAYPGEQLLGRCRLEHVALRSRGQHGLNLGGIADRREDEDRASLEEAAEPADHVAMFRIVQVDVRHDDVRFDRETARAPDRRRLRDDDQIGLRVDHGEQAFAHDGAAVYEHHVDRHRKRQFSTPI